MHACVLRACARAADKGSMAGQGQACLHSSSSTEVFRGATMEGVRDVPGRWTCEALSGCWALGAMTRCSSESALARW